MQQEAPDVFDLSKESDATLALYGIERSRLLAEQGTERAIAALGAAGVDAWPLRELARWVLHRNC